MKIIYKSENPEILLITPLLTGSKISKNTKKTIKRCDVNFDWISHEDDGNPAANTQKAWDLYRKEHVTPPFIMKLDNDIVADRGLLDKLHNSLKGSSEKFAYSYCSFEFKGNINLKFPLREFDQAVLLHRNYISFNSLIRTESLEEIGEFVTDDDYFRLLDWALWLKFLYNGYIGRPVPGAHFTALSNENSVSSGSAGDYQKKAERIKRDFVDPIMRKWENM